MWHSGSVQLGVNLPLQRHNSCSSQAQASLYISRCSWGPRFILSAVGCDYYVRGESHWDDLAAQTQVKCNDINDLFWKRASSQFHPGIKEVHVQILCVTYIQHRRWKHNFMEFLYMAEQEAVADHIAGDQSASCTWAVGTRGRTPHGKAGKRVLGPDGRIEEGRRSRREKVSQDG